MTVSLLTALIIATCTTCQHVVMTSYTAYTRLYTDMTRGFDPRTRPVVNQSDQLKVYTTFTIHRLISVDEVQQSIEMSASVNFTWLDQLRTWDPANYSGITTLHPDPLDMWRPRSIVSNSMGEQDLFKDIYTTAFIKSTGRTTWIPGGTFSTSCDQIKGLDLTYFPFDQHDCMFTFFFLSMSNEIKIQENIKDHDIEISNGEWDVSNILFEGKNYPYPDIPAMYYVRFKLKRRPMFFVVSVLIPVIFLSFLSSLVFVLPVDSGERASFSTTLLLSLTLFMGSVTGELPQKSDNFPVVVIYLFSLSLLSGLSVIAAVLQLKVKDKLSKVKTDTEEEVETMRKFSNPEDIAEMLPEENKRCRHLLMVLWDSLKGVDADIHLLVIYICVWFVLNVYFLNDLIKNH